MVSVRGYYDGTTYVATESASPFKNQHVIITLLDEPPAPKRTVSLTQLESFAKFTPTQEDAQDYVNRMRSDRGI